VQCPGFGQGRTIRGQRRSHPGQGASNLGVACIDIAQLKATIIDLGDLEPGSYTIGSTIGDAAPIQLTIS
jgi:hypothetical protein